MVDNEEETAAYYFLFFMIVGALCIAFIGIYLSPSLSYDPLKRYKNDVQITDENYLKGLYSEQDMENIKRAATQTFVDINTTLNEETLSRYNVNKLNLDFKFYESLIRKRNQEL